MHISQLRMEEEVICLEYRLRSGHFQGEVRGSAVSLCRMIGAGVQSLSQAQNLEDHAVPFDRDYWGRCIVISGGFDVR